MNAAIQSCKVSCMCQGGFTMFAMNIPLAFKVNFYISISSKISKSVKILKKIIYKNCNENIETLTEQNICADAKLQWRFTRRYLARQPNLPFKRTKKLLGVHPTPARKKRIAELTAGPMKGIVAGTRSASGNKRKRNSNPPSKWQPGICERPYLW